MNFKSNIDNLYLPDSEATSAIEIAAMTKNVAQTTIRMGLSRVLRFDWGTGGTGRPSV